MSKSSDAAKYNLSPKDIRAAKMVGILMNVALLLGRAHSDVSLPLEEAGNRAAKGYHSLMVLAMKLFPGPGNMESEVSEFAKNCGFTMEVEMVQPGPTGKQ